MQLLLLEEGINPKKSKKKSKKNKKKIKNKIKLKSPISKHHTTLLCNYYIGRGNQHKKSKSTIIYPQYLTIMQLPQWNPQSN